MVPGGRPACKPHRAMSLFRCLVTSGTRAHQHAVGGGAPVQPVSLELAPGHLLLTVDRAKQPSTRSGWCGKGRNCTCASGPGSGARYRAPLPRIQDPAHLRSKLSRLQGPGSSSRDPDSHRGPLGYEPSALLLRHPAVYLGAPGGMGASP